MLSLYALTCSSLAIVSSEVSNALFLAVYALTCSSLAMVLLGLSNARIDHIAILLLFLAVLWETLRLAMSTTAC